MNVPKGYITCREAAHKFGVHARTIERWSQSGNIDSITLMNENGQQYIAIPEDAEPINQDIRELPKCINRDCRFCVTSRCQILTECLFGRKGCPFYKPKKAVKK